MKTFFFFALALVACASDPVVDDQPILGQPPPLPTDTVPPGATTMTFAIDTVFLGDRSVDVDVEAFDAWKAFGFDIDHKDTAPSSTDVCTLAVDSPTANQEDGNNGIDNSWGLTVMPILQSALSMPTPSDTISSAIQNGGSTLDITVTGLPSDPSASSVGLSAAAFTAVPVGNGGIAAGTSAQFELAYVNQGTFVAWGTTTPLVIDLPVMSTWVELTIHHAILTFDRSADDMTVTGTIAGVLDPQEVIIAARRLGLTMDSQVCTDGSQTFAEFAQLLVEASDIAIDGTNEPGVPCTGISIGMGFTAKRVASPNVVQPWSLASPCN